MDELKRCAGTNGHWECADKYPDHMVPVDDGTQPYWCGRCWGYFCHDYYTHVTPRHPITGQVKHKWKHYKAKELGGIQNTPPWQTLLDEAEVLWGLEINKPLPKFKSKKPKFNQGLYKSSLTTPRDSTKEVEPKEGPGFVYIFEDGMKKPGFIKVGATEEVDKRLQAGNTWGAFTCLYAKEFKRRFEAEAKIFELLEDYRLYRDKEWFKINTDLAIKTIEGMYELP